MNGLVYDQDITIPKSGSLDIDAAAYGALGLQLVAYDNSSASLLATSYTRGKAKAQKLFTSINLNADEDDGLFVRVPILADVVTIAELGTNPFVGRLKLFRDPITPAGRCMVTSQSASLNAGIRNYAINGSCPGQFARFGIWTSGPLAFRVLMQVYGNNVTPGDIALATVTAATGGGVYVETYNPGKCNIGVINDDGASNGTFKQQIVGIF